MKAPLRRSYVVVHTSTEYSTSGTGPRAPPVRATEPAIRQFHKWLTFCRVGIGRGRKNFPCFQSSHCHGVERRPMMHSADRLVVRRRPSRCRRSGAVHIGAVSSPVDRLPALLHPIDPTSTRLFLVDGHSSTGGSARNLHPDSEEHSAHILPACGFGATQGTTITPGRCMHRSSVRPHRQNNGVRMLPPTCACRPAATSRWPVPWTPRCRRAQMKSAEQLSAGRIA